VWAANNQLVVIRLPWGGWSLLLF